MIKWCGLKETKISALKLSGKFKDRLSLPHVLERAKSVVAVGPINTPAVCWKLAKIVHREVAAGEDRVAAYVLVACFKLTRQKDGLAPEPAMWARAVELAKAGQGFDATIFVRVFNCDTEQEIREVRAHENAHRRNDDRDKWLASLAAPAQPDEGLEVEPGGAPLLTAAGAPPTEQPDPRGSIADFAVVDPMVPNGHMVAVNLDPPDNVAQGFDVSLNAHAVWCSLDAGHEGACRDEGAQHQQAGRPAVPSQPVTTETNREKAARYKEAAALATAVTGKTVTPAAVKQAAHRERKAAGESTPRKAHDDGTEPIGSVGLDVLNILQAVDRDLKGAATALSNGMKKHPELADRFPFDGILARLKELAKEARAFHPVAPCVFCLAEVKKDPKARCEACQGQRWNTKGEVETAPAELRKAAGL